MPVIVFAIHGKNILIGRGGKWHADGKSDAEKERIANLQRSKLDTLAAATAELLGKRPKDTLVRQPIKKKDYFSTRFIDLDDPHPPGFIKGTYPDTEHPDEKPKAAAAREFEEETFTKFDTGRFTEVSLGTKVYKIVLKDAEATEVLKNWKDGKAAGMGELVDLKWVPIADILAEKLDLNPESTEVIERLQRLKLGGRRKTLRRMFQKPKTLKKRIR
jgi:hypothetical protein